MIALKILLVSIFFLTSANSKEVISMGLLYSTIFSSKEEASLGTNLWIKQIEQKYKNIDLNIIFYEDEKNILNDYKNKKISTIIIDSIFYYDNKFFLDNLSEDRWVLSRNNNLFEQFHLVKNRNLKFDLEKIKSKTVLYKEDIGKEWLESLLLNKQINIKTLEKNSKKIRKSKKLILDVFFDKNIISIVGKDLYDSMVEINPQIKEQIEIIGTSKPIFVRALGFTRNDIKQSIRNTLLEITDKINNSTIDLEVLSFNQVQNVYVVNGNELDELEKFHKKNRSLKEKK